MTAPHHNRSKPRVLIQYTAFEPAAHLRILQERVYVMPSPAIYRREYGEDAAAIDQPALLSVPNETRALQM